MKKVWIMALLSLWWGCKPASQSQDATVTKPAVPTMSAIREHLSKELPPALVLVDLQNDAMETNVDTCVIQFVAKVRPQEDLYQAVDLAGELATLSWQPASTGGTRPYLYRVTQTRASQHQVRGTLAAVRRANWAFEQPQWDVANLVTGEPRQDLPKDAVYWGTPAAAQLVRAYIQQGRFTELSLPGQRTYHNVLLTDFRCNIASIHHAAGVWDAESSDLPAVLQELLRLDTLAPLKPTVPVARASRSPSSVPSSPASTPKRWDPQPPSPPPSDVRQLISERIRPFTSSPMTIEVHAKPAVFDDIRWAWKVEFEYSFFATDSRGRGGKRLEGVAYAWFRDKQITRFDMILPGRSLLD